MDNDLNTPVALKILWEFVKNKNENGKIQTIKKMDSVFGLDLLKLNIPKKIIELAEKRKKAREDKQWKVSDKLREQINKQGYNISDKENGSYTISGAHLVTK